MEIQQNKFAFFANFAESIRNLPKDKQPMAYQALCEYGIYGILPEDESLRLMCLMSKASIFKQDGRKNNGGNHNPTGTNQHTKLVNSSQSGQIRSKLVNSSQFLYKQETETETKTEEKEEKKEESIRGAFTPPTLEEVLTYAKDMNSIAGAGGFMCSRQTATDFFNHYDRQGWILGNGNHMTKWKPALKVWASKQVQQLEQLQ